MQNKYIQKAQNNEYVFYLHNGYAEFSYGVSVNPVRLTFCEYNELMNFISKFGFKNDVIEFEMSDEYDFHIPKVVMKIIGFSLLTVSPIECCVYTSESERNNCLVEKEKLIQILDNKN